MSEILILSIDEVGITVNKPDVNLVFFKDPDQGFCGDGEENIVCIKLENVFTPACSYRRVLSVRNSTVLLVDDHDARVSTVQFIQKFTGTVG